MTRDEAKAKILNQMASILRGKCTDDIIKETTKFAADNDLMPFLKSELENLSQILLSKAEHAKFK